MHAERPLGLRPAIGHHNGQRTVALAAAARWLRCYLQTFPNPYCNVSTEWQQCDAFGCLDCARQLAAENDESVARHVGAALGKLKSAAVLVSIHRRFADNTLTLTFCASRAEVSPWHLSRMLTTHTGAGFETHLHLTRIYHARRLLRSTWLSVKEIAAEVGYNQTRSLDRHFRGMCHSTPSEFRRMCDLRDSAAHASPIWRELDSANHMDCKRRTQCASGAIGKLKVGSTVCLRPESLAPGQ